MPVHLLGDVPHLPLEALGLGISGKAGPNGLGILLKTLQQQGVESAALPIENHLDRLFVGKWGFVDPDAGKGVVHVRQRHHLGGDGNVVSLQPVGISPAVVTLVVPAADLVGHVHQGIMPVNRKIFQHIRADGGVSFHHGEFLVRQPAGLVENFFVNGDFADVVEGGGGGDDRDVPGTEAVAVGLLGQLPQQQVCQSADMENVQAALAVAEFHDMAENINHQVALTLFFIDLVCHHARQLFLLGVQENGVHRRWTISASKGRAIKSVTPNS